MSGGYPIAHPGYFRAKFVVRRGWLSERAYGDLVALCQFLPGPASSQVGMALGLSRAGYTGALAAYLVLLLPSAWVQVGVIWLSLFFSLLAGLPLLTQLFPERSMAMFDVFYRAGSLVFGGGHVVLPLLRGEVVQAGWVGSETFLAGYGAAQAVPGPLFTFAAFLGASMNSGPSGWAGGVLCLVGIFLPSFLLVAGTLPFWGCLCRDVRAQAALSGVNAAVVGLLLAALYQPVWVSAMHRPEDFCLALAALVALMFWKLPPWLVVIGCALGGWFLSL